MKLPPHKSSHPTGHVGGYKPWKPEEELVMQPSEYHTFRTAAYNYKAKYGVLFDIIYYGGLRVSEALKIKPSDIKRDINTITINTLKRKYKKSKCIERKIKCTACDKRITCDVRNRQRRDDVSYAPEIIDILCLYIEKAKIKQDQLVFRTNRIVVWRVMRQLEQSIPGFRSMLSPHSLRHGYGTMMMEEKNDIGTVAKKMRHANAQHTFRYSHETSRRAQEDAEALKKRIDSYKGDKR